MVVGGQRHAPTAVTPEKTWYLLYRMMGGPQGRSERVQRNSLSPRLDSRTVQHVASRYTELGNGKLKTASQN